LISSFMVYQAESTRNLEESFLVDSRAALNLNPGIDEYGIPAVYPPYDLVCTVTGDNDVEMNWQNAEIYDA
ncbi:MAG: hypothetical protein ACE5OP_13820, partial [Candidatus Glassbacteria bacterium]